MRRRRWVPVLPSWTVGMASLLLLLPAVAAQEYGDPTGDTEADGLDVKAVVVTFGNGTIGIQVHFEPGDVPDERAVRGVVVLGAPGEAEPAEWYHVTIANETTVYVAHGDAPRPGELLATSWTGDIASAEWRREAPAADPACAFAVVEAGTMGSTGFVRSDVAPPGFASPEEAWPVDACPTAAAAEAAQDDDEEEKGSPGLPFVALLAVVAVAWLRRR